MGTAFATKDLAEKEVTAWLDYKRVKENKREAYKANIDAIVDAVFYGELSIDSSTFEIKQKLALPVEGLFSELVYKPRLSVGELQKHRAGAKNMEDNIIAAISALTGKSNSHIQKMDTEDYAISAAIGVFFI